MWRILEDSRRRVINRDRIDLREDELDRLAGLLEIEKSST
jgi:hypothetical protein